MIPVLRPGARCMVNANATANADEKDVMLLRIAQKGQSWNDDEDSGFDEMLLALRPGIWCANAAMFFLWAQN